MSVSVLSWVLSEDRIHLRIAAKARFPGEQAMPIRDTNLKKLGLTVAAMESLDCVIRNVIGRHLPHIHREVEVDVGLAKPRLTPG